MNPSTRPPRASTAIVLTGADAPRVDSRVLAESMGKRHQDLFELVKTHRASFEQLGVLRFQTGKPTNGRPEKFALLTEDQAYFLLTLTRNTARTVTLKVKLVKAFSEARKVADLRRTEYLPSYHLAHDALRGLAPDTEHQRLLHMNVNRLANKVAGIEAGHRGAAQHGSLAVLAVAQMLAARAVAGAADDKAAYQRIKSAVKPLRALGGTLAC